MILLQILKGVRYSTQTFFGRKLTTKCIKISIRILSKKNKHKIDIKKKEHHLLLSYYNLLHMHRGLHPFCLKCKNVACNSNFRLHKSCNTLYVPAENKAHGNLQIYSARLVKIRILLTMYNPIPRDRNIAWGRIEDFHTQASVLNIYTTPII